MRVCMPVFMHACMFAIAYALKCRGGRVHLSVRVRARRNVCVIKQLHNFSARMCTYVHVYFSVHMFTYVHIRTCVRTCVRTSVCIS